ncbi:LON peptidase substrate-binding domain-containing protein [Allosphingosinicella flava]|uniref:LON peptidase substrate-binding domain-containing protein n=1 Tax=Allosphingosinicella flava TaxID=2771430 RepID=A0A7T2LLH4_9SPHN|nr:LON peptidase substrate-binding domain-containing protein [Sphingosinicella flava]QPQ54520.1 LON peptidase substrate-binding domain-containing protein [Sphingosinicella flava]
MSGEPFRVPVFPLAGAVLFPRSQLPLHIFEPCYRAMTKDALDGEGLIAMVQPRETGDRPALFDIGCLGQIVDSEALDDGRFNIVLEGVKRFRILREIPVETPYRQIEIDMAPFVRDDEEAEALASIQRASLEREARRYAEALGYAVDWNAVSRLDDEMLVNGIAQIAPLDVGSKQALLEADTIAERGDLLAQFMQFQVLVPGGADMPETMQ